MSLQLLSRQYGSSYAGAPVIIRETRSNGPVRVYATLAGGVISKTGQATLDANGSLNVYVDQAGSYNVTVLNTATRKPVLVTQNETPDGSSVSSKPNNLMAVQALGSKSGTVTVDLALGVFVTWTNTAAVTLAFSNLPAQGQARRVIVTVTNGGVGGVTWPSGTRWTGSGAAGTAPTLGASTVDKVQIDIYNPAGTVLYDATSLGRLA